MSLESWDEYYNAVVTFVGTNSYIPRYNDFSSIPITTTQIPKSEHDLGIWCAFQRKCYNEGALPKDRIDQLETIDKWIWEIDLSWTEEMVFVQKFSLMRERLPDDQLHHADQIEKDLGKFVRRFYGKKNIPKYKRFFLEQIPSYKSG